MVSTTSNQTATEPRPSPGGAASEEVTILKQENKHHDLADRRAFLDVKNISAPIYLTQEIS